MVHVMLSMARVLVMVVTMVTTVIGSVHLVVMVVVACPSVSVSMEDNVIM